MKKSKYVYFFETEDEYVGYSWLADAYIAFPLSRKNTVAAVLDNNNNIIANEDVAIYKKLCAQKAIIPDSFDEYRYLLLLRDKAIHRDDVLSLTIVPTMNCNCRCPYCYELHQNKRLPDEVIHNLKTFIHRKIDAGVKQLAVSWFGGEPLLEINTIEVIGAFCVQLCQDKGITHSFGITSNAVLLNEQSCRALAKAGINSFHFTLEGSKDTHDRTRVTAHKQATFETIVSNIKNFLEFDAQNKIIVRIHVHSTAEAEIAEIEQTFNRFSDYKERVSFYFRTIHTACTERWEYAVEPEVAAAQELAVNLNNILGGLYQKCVSLGFQVPDFFTGRRFSYCEAETDSHWAVRPDGFLNKCTVAIEKERSQAILINGDIKIIWERLFAWAKKDYTLGAQRCRECPVLPFC